MFHVVIIVVIILQKKYPVLYEESMNTVLLQELIRYEILQWLANCLPLLPLYHKLGSARSGFPYPLSAVALSPLRSSAAVMCSLYIKRVCFIPKNGAVSVSKIQS